jgi:SpoIIAA-like
MVEGVLESDVLRGEAVYLNCPGVGVVTWNPTTEAVHIKWHGWADSTERKELLEAGLIALTERRGSRWLADCRDMKAVKQSDQDWIDRSWFPRILAAGLSRMAIVIPKSGLAKMNVEDILSRVPGNTLDTECFATVENAIDWLTRPPTIPPNADANVNR